MSCDHAEILRGLHHAGGEKWVPYTTDSSALRTPLCLKCMEERNKSLEELFHKKIFVLETTVEHMKEDMAYMRTMLNQLDSRSNNGRATRSSKGKSDE
jgi:hypothetical protein